VLERSKHFLKVVSRSPLTIICTSCLNDHDRSWPATLISSFPDDITIIEDALQDAYLKFFLLVRAGSSRIRSLNYLVVIARNCLVDELRKRRGRISFDEITRNDVERVSDYDNHHIENQIIIIAAMTKLDNRTRYILESYYLQDCPI
jgi:RNA polymerase sigma factor (sigma-70 family)